MKKEELDSFYEKVILNLQNKLSDIEQRNFLEILEADKLLEKLYFQLKDVWEYHQIGDEASRIDLDQAWAEMLTKHHLLDDDEVTEKIAPPKISLKVQKKWMIAAAILFLTGLGVLIGTQNQLFKDNLLVHEFECPKGEMVKINLSDGTTVWLNSDSKLTMKQNFSPNHRELSFVGEAYFNVQSDRKHPFIINVANRQVEVKGTVFNIRYYPEEELFQTSLEEGVVLVHSDNRLIELLPGEQLSINTATGKSQLKKMSKVEDYSAWRTGKLMFENMPMENLMQLVERWYNHEIILDDPDLLNLKLSGVLKRNKSIEHFMKVLSLAQSIEYEIKEDTIHISKMND